MHKTKHSASPYIYELTLDSNLPLSSDDVTEFKHRISRGVAVFGFTPNVLIVTSGAYKHWSTVALLSAVMLTGRLAICTDDQIAEEVDAFQRLCPSIRIKCFARSDITACRAWVYP